MAIWFRQFPIVCSLGRNTLGEFRKFAPLGDMVSAVSEGFLLSAVALERRLQGLRILLFLLFHENLGRIIIFGNGLNLHIFQFFNDA
ncbi:hypothetical protein [uncultured Chryseobacterium sp.]|uniref:hypothetical protein n=1 Tax=uncultured Chryseobacterium sp. TaxID=259322 RepID=UPI00258D4E18|nr:hypothetical protein [uncultured Chryseobacterium sp.]